MFKAWAEGGLDQSLKASVYSGRFQNDWCSLHRKAQQTDAFGLSKGGPACRSTSWVNCMRITLIFVLRTDEPEYWDLSKTKSKN